MTAAAPSARTPLVVGRYALFDEIAKGGMATVHIGRLLGPVGFLRTVAIKRLHPELARDPEFVSMFIDEARLAARIRHPNVAPTLDVVADRGELFLVMEYLEGEALSGLIRKAASAGSRIPAELVASILVGALHGLHAAHEALDDRGRPLELVHRDVSPQNLFVGKDGMTRVLDFGVAKAAGRIQSTRAGLVKGKLTYMAPEQLRSEVVTRQADIYAIAVVLWEVLTGKRLFQGDAASIVRARLRDAEVPRPSQVGHSPPELDDLVLRGLATDPKERFATALEMAIALERVVVPASVSEVATWMRELSGPGMGARAAQVAAIEALADSIPDLTDVVNHLEATREADDAALVATIRTDLPPSSGETPPSGETTLPGEPTTVDPVDDFALAAEPRLLDRQDAAHATSRRRRRIAAVLASLFAVGLGALALARAQRNVSAASTSRAAPPQVTATDPPRSEATSEQTTATGGEEPPPELGLPAAATSEPRRKAPPSSTAGPRRPRAASHPQRPPGNSTTSPYSFDNLGGRY